MALHQSKPSSTFLLLPLDDICSRSGGLIQSGVHTPSCCDDSAQRRTGVLPVPNFELAYHKKNTLRGRARRASLLDTWGILFRQAPGGPLDPDPELISP